MDQKEKMKELIKKKQGGGKAKQMATPKTIGKTCVKVLRFLINNRQPLQPQEECVNYASYFLGFFNNKQCFSNYEKIK